MRMPVMNIREMCMTVLERCMLVGMTMRLRVTPRKIVRVLVMFVVHVIVGVVQHLMRVFVPVIFRQMQPHAQRHQSRRDPECQRGRFSEEDYGTAAPMKGAVEK